MRYIIASMIIMAATVGLTGYTYIPFTNDYEVCISDNELELYHLINTYRKSKKLPVIPLSSSLTYVAREHARDLAENRPDSPQKCNAHSWSKSTRWTDCCYTADHKQATCMWNKPAELTNYQGKGFEIVTYVFVSNDPHYSVKPAEALDSWSHSSGHNSVIINSGTWKKTDWKAIGVGIYEGYAIAWFGMESDVAGPPVNCN